MTPLHRAAGLGYSGLISGMIDRGAVVDRATAQFGRVLGGDSIALKKGLKEGPKVHLLRTCASTPFTGTDFSKQFRKRD